MKVKIILDKNESLEEAKEEIVKALQVEPKKPKQFRDPVVESINKELNKHFQEMYNAMIKEVLEIIKLDDFTIRQMKK